MKQAGWFQSTHPYGVRPYPASRLRTTKRFQSTHPYGVRRGGKAIKTHSACFNPRTRMGCDQPCVSNPRFLAGFNPRTRMGCDPVYICHISTLKFQSTHPYGVRRQALTTWVLGLCFNPRTRMGCDSFPYNYNPDMTMFQSTHPYGVRLRCFQEREYHYCFNPRTRMGCDRILSNELNVIVQIYRICE